MASSSLLLVSSWASGTHQPAVFCFETTCISSGQKRTCKDRHANNQYAVRQLSQAGLRMGPKWYIASVELHGAAKKTKITILTRACVVVWALVSEPAASSCTWGIVCPSLGTTHKTHRAIPVAAFSNSVIEGDIAENLPETENAWLDIFKGQPGRRVSVFTMVLAVHPHVEEMR